MIICILDKVNAVCYYTAVSAIWKSRCLNKLHYEKHVF